MQNLPSVTSEIDSKTVLKVIRKDFKLISPYFHKLNLEWMIEGYNVFKDLDKYIILIYLINKDFEFYRRNSLNINYENFFKDKTLEIDKINLINLSKDLIIPKESVRRKVCELEKSKIIKKIGKKFLIDRTVFKNFKIESTLKNFSALITIFSKILKNEKLSKNTLSSGEAIKLMKQNFSFVWYQYYKFVFIYYYRWKKYFKDLEIFIIIATITVNSSSKIIKNSLGSGSFIDKWRNEMKRAETQGINTMSISEITGIPRPTVVRKIKYLLKNDYISIDKRKLINIKLSNKKSKEVFKIQDENLISLSEFIIRVFNQILIK